MCNIQWITSYRDTLLDTKSVCVWRGGGGAGGGGLTDSLRRDQLTEEGGEQNEDEGI